MVGSSSLLDHALGAGDRRDYQLILKNDLLSHRIPPPCLVWMLLSINIIPSILHH